jgi:hypothetical protein
MLSPASEKAGGIRRSSIWAIVSVTALQESCSHLFFSKVMILQRLTSLPHHSDHLFSKNLAVKRGALNQPYIKRARNGQRTHIFDHQA